MERPVTGGQSRQGKCKHGDFNIVPARYARNAEEDDQPATMTCGRCGEWHLAATWHKMGYRASDQEWEEAETRYYGGAPFRRRRVASDPALAAEPTASESPTQETISRRMYMLRVALALVVMAAILWLSLR